VSNTEDQSVRAKMIEKIKKCLALSSSSNEHEAASALRQARKIMEAYSISSIEIEAGQAEEWRSMSRSRSTPALWETELVNRLANAFGCEVLFASGPGIWQFVGCGGNPEIVQYAFDVLYRQILRARRQYIKTKLTRCKTGTKTRRADFFCYGWVVSATEKIEACAGNEKQTKAIEAYMSLHYPSIEPLKPRTRKDGEVDDYCAGRVSGKDAELNRGIGADSQPLALS
jgi:hypothetical protein